MRQPATISARRVTVAASAVVAALLALTASTGATATEAAAAAPSSDRAAHAHAHAHSSVHSHHASTTTTTARPAPTPDDVTRSAHIGYLSCPAPDVLLTASIQEGPFAPGQLVTYRVSVHNLARTACGTPGRTFPTVPTTPNFALGLLGPCGELSVVIYNAEGTNVYPGPVAFSCPMIVGPRIAPGQTIATTGMWQPTGSPGPGSYRLVIDGKVTLPIVIAATPSAPGLPTPTPAPTLPGSGSLPTPSTPVGPPSALPTPTVPSRLPRP
jgi:hypothetical protein